MIRGHYTRLASIQAYGIMGSSVPVMQGSESLPAAGPQKSAAASAPWTVFLWVFVIWLLVKHL